MKFIIENKLYDTEKMKLVGRVKKWYEYEGYCDLYRSQKGNWLLVHIGEQGDYDGEAISEKEAKSLLMRYDYDAYAKEYGELEEA